MQHIKFTNSNLKRKFLPGFLLLLISLSLLLGLLPGCSATTPVDNTEDGRLKVVTSLFVTYDLVCSIAGDKADLDLLLPPGVDVHSYEPTPQDIIMLDNADLFISNGGHSEAWLDRLLASDKINPGVSLRMMDYVELKEEASSGIIETDSGHNHDHEDDGLYGTADEHIWTSPANVIKMAAAIKAELIELDPQNTEFYETNYLNLEKGLKDLDQRFRSIVAKGPRDYIVVADRFPLIYFVSEYGLNYYAAYEACAAQSEPAPRTLSTLIDLVKEKNVAYIFTIEFSSEKLADSIVAETGAKKLLFHTVHNITQEQIDQGVSYLDLMNQNADNLEKALADD